MQSCPLGQGHCSPIGGIGGEKDGQTDMEELWRGTWHHEEGEKKLGNTGEMPALIYTPAFWEGSPLE
jgi:hypothetical protein